MEVKNMRRNGRRIVVGGLREEIEGKNMGRKGRRNGSGTYGKKRKNGSGKYGDKG